MVGYKMVNTEMAKATSAEDYKLITSFEAVKQILLDDRYSDRMERPLAFWALPNDRRLPLAFLGRTLGDLLNTPFEELSATPGIGQKKIYSLVRLLHRTTNQEPPAASLEDAQRVVTTAPTQAVDAIEEVSFDPAVVSEALWEKWRATVREHNLGYIKLGCLAPTLQAIPTVIWHTPLSQYLDYTVAEIRQFKTHGEKRVRVVLEVFYIVHEMLSNCRLQHHLAVRLMPNFLVPVELWVASVLDSQRVPNTTELNDKLVQPLLEQVRVDIGDTVHQLAEGRVGIDAAPASVRMQSRKMGVTRARIYQLLDDCSKVMEVRWPSGRRQLADLADLFKNKGLGEDELAAFAAVRELFYPEKYDELANTEED